MPASAALASRIVPPATGNEPSPMRKLVPVKLVLRNSGRCGSGATPIEWRTMSSKQAPMMPLYWRGNSAPAAGDMTWV
jgi:hypothetical protein